MGWDGGHCLKITDSSDLYGIFFSYKKPQIQIEKALVVLMEKSLEFNPTRHFKTMR